MAAAFLSRLLHVSRTTDDGDSADGEGRTVTGTAWEAERVRALAERVADQALTSRREAAGAVDGRYWASLKPAISDLEAEERFDEARDLLEKCVAAAEREATVTLHRPDTWPTEEISVVLRRTGRFDQERRFLERYAARCMPSRVPQTIEQRLRWSQRTSPGG